MSMTGVGEVADLVTTAINKIWPDKTEQEKAEIAGVFNLLQGQMEINKTEAASNDPMQHWRGGLGWVCVSGYALNFVISPLLMWGSTLVGHPLVLPVIDLNPLSILAMGMLGLSAGIHGINAWGNKA
jgi:hypothetical protein